MDYKARFYSPVLNRFIQPDSIVPSLYSPQTLNRFSYVGNNPIRFNDPSGHCQRDANADDCFRSGLNNPPSFDEQLKQYGVTVTGVNKKEKKAILEAVITIGDEFVRVYNKNCTENCQEMTSQDIFVAAFGNISINKASDSETYCSAAGYPNINCGGGINLTARLIAHELGHFFAIVAGGNPYRDMGIASIFDANNDWVTGTHFDNIEGVWEWGRSMRGYTSGCTPGTYHGRCEVNGQLVWDDWNSPNEEYADMFLNWSYNSFADNSAGDARYAWMEQRMWGWLSVSINP